MNKVIWSKRYEIGVDFIDKEHQQLLSRVNKLLDLIQEEGKGKWACREGIKYMRNHAIEHFEHEEEYMLSINYSDYEIHKSMHNEFQYHTLPSLEEELEETDYSEDAIRHFIGVSIGWLSAHMQTEDMAVVGKKMSKWTNLPVAEELEALEQTILQLFKSTFQIKAKTISRHYGGEEFGKVFCCRLIYLSENKKDRWEVMISYEEKLLLKIVNDLMSTQYLKVDDMVINIVRYMSRQLVEKIKDCFPEVENFKLISEDLLTQEQFVKTFEREHPTYSYLFDTGSGYFAFCERVTDSARGKIIDPLNAMNAMSLIRDYLSEDTGKKKILVVDDSDFMRQSLIKLLGNEYEVSDSSSSVSAIKSLAVNRPDLILLDYEMPVCDGRQALEMIRSDEEIADIPVVFLTGKGDAESVRNVMALKPRGYLLKSMPEEDIKKFIDGVLAGE